MTKTITTQERIISNLVCFMHDSLDQIFQKALEKQQHVVQTLRIMGQQMKKEEQSDPFKLYQGYLNVVKPIDYELEKQDLEDMLAELRERLEQSELKCATIQSACEQYLKEEQELKQKLCTLEDNLAKEK